MTTEVNKKAAKSEDLSFQSQIKTQMTADLISLKHRFIKILCYEDVSNHEEDEEDR